jgi:diguanylate cyclase (GGDEF)-like protein
MGTKGDSRSSVHSDTKVTGAFRSLFPLDVEETIALPEYRRIARIRLGSIVVLAAINFLLRHDVTRRWPDRIDMFDLFLAITLWPQLVSALVNLGALRWARSTRVWEAVMCISATLEVWWACCAGWVEGVSSRPLPWLVLLIVVYRFVLARRVGTYTLVLSLVGHGVLLLVERLGLVPLNPLGEGLPAYAWIRLFWIPATYSVGWLLASLAVLRVRRAQQALRIANAALEKALGEASDLARRDPLTRVWNRRYLHERLGDELARADRLQKVVSLLMLDLDWFKRINDEHGHAAGDETLVAFADLLKRQTRRIDIVARYGGEEFVVVLPETDLSAARLVADRIRLAQRNQGLHTTVSIGVADSSQHGQSIDALLAAADSALYAAKGAGRDRVHIAGESSA